jgi:hypothetical protein
MRRRSRVAVVASLFVVSGFVVAAVVAIPSGTVGRVAAGQVKLPVTLEASLFGLCMPDIDELIAEMDAARPDAAGETAFDGLAFSTSGAGGDFTASVEAPGAWRVDASRAGVTMASEYGKSDRSSAPPLTPAALDFARQLYDCLSTYRFVDETTSLASSSQLVQWYKYDRTVLWPCLAAHGLAVGDPPSREDFADPFRAQSVDPFRDVKVSKSTIPKLLAAVQQCPLRPSYLR